RSVEMTAVWAGPRCAPPPPPPRDVPPADPENVAPPRVLHAGDLLMEHAAAKVRHPNALHVGAGDRREVDVEQCVLGKVLDAHDALDQALEAVAVAVEV